MFRISKLTDYGIVVMTQFAMLPGSLHNPRELSEKTHIAIPTVTKILKILTRYGLLQSQRGKEGGYTLAKAPEDISVTDIIKAIEGDLGLTECSQADSHCVIEKLCSTRSNWRLISQVIHDALDQIRLSDMAKPIVPQHMNTHILNYVKPALVRYTHDKT